MIVEVFKTNSRIGTYVDEMDVRVLPERGALTIHGSNADRFFRMLQRAGLDTPRRDWSIVLGGVEYERCDIWAVGGAALLPTSAVGFVLCVNFMTARSM